MGCGDNSKSSASPSVAIGAVLVDGTCGCEGGGEELSLKAG